MKSGFIFLLGMAPFLAFAGSSAEIVSVPYPLGRYDSVLNKSPFVKETPFASVQGSRLGEDIIITGHFQIEGVIYVNVLNKKTQERMVFSSADKNAAHPKVLSLSNDIDPYKASAVIQMGSETATIGLERPAAPRILEKSSEKTASSSSSEARHGSAAGSTGGKSKDSFWSKVTQPFLRKISSAGK